MTSTKDARSGPDVTDRLAAARDDRPLIPDAPPPPNGDGDHPELVGLGQRVGEAITQAEQGDLPEADRRELVDELHTALATLGDSQPTPPAVPVLPAVSGGHVAGTSIADPVAHSALNAVLFPGVTDPVLQNEMAWTRILAPLVIELATYHADGGPSDRPTLAPDDLIAGVIDAALHLQRAVPAALPSPTGDGADG